MKQTKCGICKKGIGACVVPDNLVLIHRDCLTRKLMSPEVANHYKMLEVNLQLGDAMTIAILEKYGWQRPEDMSCCDPEKQ